MNTRVARPIFGYPSHSKAGMSAVLSRNAQKHEKPGTLNSGLEEVARLENLNVLGLKALGAFGHGEFDGLTFLKAAESTGRNRREMYEDIFAVLPADKAESLRIVKPLHCSLFHCVVPVFLNFLLRRSVAAWSG